MDQNTIRWTRHMRGLLEDIDADLRCLDETEDVSEVLDSLLAAHRHLRHAANRAFDIIFTNDRY